MTLKTKSIINFAFILLSISSCFAQSWSYVGTSVCCINGPSSYTEIVSPELVFKSNGNALLIGAANTINNSDLLAKEFNGTFWQNMPSVHFNQKTTIFDLEMFNDIPYVAVSNGINVQIKKFNGTTWISVGNPIIFDVFSENFDFVIDNNGIPYIACASSAKIYKYNGNSWAVWTTLPAFDSGVIFLYLFIYDNTTVFDSNNNFNYVASSTINTTVIAHVIRNFNGIINKNIGDTLTIADQTIGDVLFKNKTGELYTANTTNSKPIIKKLIGNKWTIQGNISTLPIMSPQAKIAFTNMPNQFIYTAKDDPVSSLAVSSVYSCNGTNTPYVSLGQVTTSVAAKAQDIIVNPSTGKIWICITQYNSTGNADFSVLEYNNGVSGMNDLSSSEQKNIQLFPNPANASIFISKDENIYIDKVVIKDVFNKTIEQFSGTEISLGINISKLTNGVYFAEVYDTNESIVYIKFIKQ